MTDTAVMSNLGERIARLEVTTYGNGDKEASVVARAGRNAAAIAAITACVEPEKGSLDARIACAVEEGFKQAKKAEHWIKYLMEWMLKLGPTITSLAGLWAIIQKLSEVPK